MTGNRHVEINRVDGHYEIKVNGVFFGSYDDLQEGLNEYEEAVARGDFE